MAEVISNKPTVVRRVTRTDRSKAQEFQFDAAAEEVLKKPSAFKEVREDAWQEFKRLPIPDIRNEAWRRTDLSGLGADQFLLSSSSNGHVKQEAPKWLLEPIADGAHGGEIILSASAEQVFLDPQLAGKGVIFTTLEQAMREYPQLLEKIWGKAVKAEDGKFAALSLALAEQGVFLYVPKGVEVDVPLHSVLWGPGVHQAYITHLLVYLEDESKATYVHESASPTEDGQTLHSGLVEIFVGKRAEFNFVELQSWGESVWNISHEKALVDEGGKLDWIFGAIGSKLTKNFSDINLIGAGSVGKMSGFYFTDNQQHLDHDTQQNHFAPNTTSDLLFKGALIQESRSVWQGMIYVSPEAQKTDGYQANRNLVLSRKARADSIPGLEILANDVRCTHGATVGKIDDEMLFYMMARGIPRQIAERTIVEGFFDPIMERIPFEGVKQRFKNTISHKMDLFEQK